MPDIEVSDLNDFALLWLPAGVDEYGKQLRQPTCTEIPVRWNEQQSEALDPRGTVIPIDATVIVAQEVPIDSFMWHGRLIDLAASLGTDGGLPTPQSLWNTLVPKDSLFLVKTRGRTPDIKGRAIRRQMGLMRWNDVLTSTT